MVYMFFIFELSSLFYNGVDERRNLFLTTPFYEPRKTIVSATNKGLYMFFIFELGSLFKKGVDGRRIFFPHNMVGLVKETHPPGSPRADLTFAEKISYSPALPMRCFF